MIATALHRHAVAAAQCYRVLRQQPAAAILSCQWIMIAGPSRRRAAGGYPNSEQHPAAASGPWARSGALSTRDPVTAHKLGRMRPARPQRPGRSRASRAPEPVMVPSFKLAALRP